MGLHAILYKYLKVRIFPVISSRWNSANPKYDVTKDIIIQNSACYMGPFAFIAYSLTV